MTIDREQIRRRVEAWPVDAEDRQIIIALLDEIVESQARVSALVDALLTIRNVRHDGSSGDMRYVQSVARAAIAKWEQE